MVEWLQARFAEVSPEAPEESQPSELSNVRAEIMKNKKRIKSMMAMLESQNKLLRALAVTIDPKFQLPDDPEGNMGSDNTDAGLKASLEPKLEREEPLDDTRG